MKIGITGARGVLGRTLLKRSSSRLEWTEFPGDIKRQSDVDNWLDAHTDLCALVHLAAVVPTRDVEDDLANALDVNVGGTCRLLTAVRRRFNSEPFPWMFLASTSHVYRSSETPLSEDSIVDPISKYGLTKFQSEEWAIRLAREYGVRLCIGRLFSYAAASQPASYFLPSMIERIRAAPRNGRLEIPGLCGTRDFLSAEAVADIILALVEKQPEGTINIASGVATQLSKAAQAVRDKIGRSDIEIVTLPQNTCHLPADVRKLRTILPEAGRGFSLERFLDELLSG